MPTVIEVIQPTTNTVVEVVQPAAPVVYEIAVPGPQGPSALSVGTTNTLTPGTPGMWLQTGLGPDGTDFTLWIEDGQ